MRYSRADFLKTNQICVWLGDLGSGEKKIIFRKFVSYFRGYGGNLIERMLSIRLKYKKANISPNHNEN
jgi:hypothetical protein